MTTKSSAGLTARKELTELGDILVVYRRGMPIGNFQFERFGPNQSGVNLRWRDSSGPHMIHFVGATEESVMRQWKELAMKHILKKNPDISRSPGQVVKAGGVPYVVGGGYRGSTEALDRKVQASARALSRIFNLPVQIRFNSDRESGGAWLKDSHGGFWSYGSIGIGAGIRHKKPAGMSDEAWWHQPREFWYSQPRVMYIFTYVQAEHLKDPSIANSGTDDSRYHSMEHPSISAAIDWLKRNARFDNLNPLSKGITVRGIAMSRGEYEGFVKYLNAIKAERFTKADVGRFLEAIHTDREARERWMSANPRETYPPKMRLIWMRAGDNAEYDSYGDTHVAGYTLGTMLSELRKPGDLTFRWRPLGVEVAGFTGNNYVSLFWGDDNAQPVARAELSKAQKEEFKRGVKQAMS